MSSGFSFPKFASSRRTRAGRFSLELKWLDSEQIDLHGVARLRARLSQTMTGWKRIAIKPVDPFFSKAGAGTLLPIKVTGTRGKPEFGLDRGAKPKAGEKAGSADRRVANY